MPAALSAGLVIWKQTSEGKLVLLCHPGGPYYQKKDNEVWTIPKGLVPPDEDLLQTAIRETQEECGFIPLPNAEYIPLTPVKYKNGKILHAWAVQIPNSHTWHFTSNTFQIEWPPRSGRLHTFPEIDCMEWFTLPKARKKIHPIQLPLLDKIENL